MGVTTGTGCPEGMWNLPPQKLFGHGPGQPVLGGPVYAMEVKPGNFQGSLPASVVE